MTVKQLINKLKELPENEKICFNDLWEVEDIIKVKGIYGDYLVLN